MTEATEKKLSFVRDGDFLAQLQNADWTYAYSDDRRSYERGQRSVSLVRGLANYMGRSQDANDYANMVLKPHSDELVAKFAGMPEFGVTITPITWGRDRAENYQVTLKCGKHFNIRILEVIAKIDASSKDHSELVPCFTDVEFTVSIPFPNTFRSKYPEIAAKWDTVQGNIYKFNSTAQVYDFVHNVLGV